MNLEADTIPPHWSIATLQDVATWGSGGTPKATNSTYYGGDIPWAVIGDLNDGVVTETAKSITSLGLEASSAKLVESGAVLVAMYGASIGRLGIVGTRMATNQAIAFAYPDEEVVLRKYLLFYLMSQKARFLEAGKGAAQANISQTILKAWPIPVPPIDEQRRIVEAIETHLSHLDAGVETLVRAKRKLERMRAAVLRAAVEGSLVPHVKDGVSADELLTQVIGERRQTWKTIGRRTKYRDPVEANALARVSGHWVVAAMDTLAYTRLGKMLSRKARTGTNPKPYLRNQNVQWGRFDLTDIAEMDILPDEEDRYRLRPGDLLVCEGGEVGRCAIWKDEATEMYYQKALHRVRPYQGVSSAWLALVLEYLAFNRLLDEYVTGSTIDHLPQEDLRVLPVPLPPPSEQKAILAEVDRQVSLLDGLERDIERATGRANGLRSAVLSGAFSGSLLQVPAST